MATIAALTEDFEGGSNGATVTTSNTFFDNVNAVGPPTFSSAQAVEGSLSCFWTDANVCEANLTAETTLWVSFYIYMTATATSNTAIFNAYGNSAANKILDVRVLAGTSQLQLRSVNTARWNSTDLTTGAWHRVEVGMTVGSTIELKIYSGANLHTTTVSQQSGSQSNTNTTATNVDNVRWGLISADATLDFYLDRVRGDDATAPAPHSSSTNGDVTAVPATFSTQAVVPAVSAEQVVSGGGAATFTADALLPTVSATATVTITPPVATFSTLALAPVVQGEINNAVTGTGHSTAPNATVTATGTLTLYGAGIVFAPRPTVDAEGISVAVLYSPPVYERPMHTRERILTFYRLTYADSIVRQNGVFVSVKSPSKNMLEGLVEGVDWFKGGGVYMVSPAQALELSNAGFPSSI